MSFKKGSSIKEIIGIAQELRGKYPLEKWKELVKMAAAQYRLEHGKNYTKHKKE